MSKWKSIIGRALLFLLIFINLYFAYSFLYTNYSSKTRTRSADGLDSTVNSVYSMSSQLGATTSIRGKLQSEIITRLKDVSELANEYQTNHTPKSIPPSSGTRDSELTNELNNNQTRHTPEPIPPSSGTRGYVLAGDYWEQFSSGSRNLQNLQCWAGKVGVGVVEPFQVKSVLRTILGRALPQLLRFSDMIDLGRWNEENRKMGSAELVAWEKFLKEAPRNLITVHIRYAYTSEIRDSQREIKQNPGKFPPRDVRYKEGCSSDQEWPKLAVVKEMGFKIIRRVCFNFKYGDALTPEEFTAGVYGPLSPDTTTVFFKQWRGLADSGRIIVRKAGCSNTGIQEHMPPSQRLTAHAEEYISKYLTNKTNSDYIAIIARVEKSKIAAHNRPGIVPYCLSQTLDQWKRLASSARLKMTFLSIDMGKYGSNSFKYEKKDFETFFHQLYGDRWSVPEWERSFEEVGGTRDAGYIALLQKMIVTRGTCVVFVGGGSFQKHALTLYESRVPRSQWCVQVVKECTKDNNLRLYQ